mmetsp:Transcript_40067/g.125426  ORF Transcript_40067/g.125426 Transcript_40067/m.125426 type:complete len:107 (-) Transcript_40067:940-1260(-)
MPPPPWTRAFTWFPNLAPAFLASSRPRYCRFFQGRRTTDDARQISRALKCMGPTGRFRIQLMNKVIRGNTTFDDRRISPVIRQSLQHWGYELTEAHLKAYCKKKGW